jgi:type I restriction enzyme M protein
VHHHNGFLNVNGVFEGRFDIILTNPPFGANVEKSTEVTEADVAMDPDIVSQYETIYGEAYREARDAAVAAVGTPIGELFDLGTNEKGQLLKQKTEILFIERCLDLLQPGGRLGIVLPEGVLNNPSLQYVRDYCEDRARILAVISLPQDTFLSTGATVKASLLFARKYTEEEQERYDRLYEEAREETDAKYASEIKAEEERFTKEIEELQAGVDEKMKAPKEAVNVARKGLRAAEKALTELAGKKGATAARKEVEARQADLLAATEARQAMEVSVAPVQKQIAALNSELASYLREMESKKVAEARALLKQRFPYYVFLYEAERVGISATGEQDLNELYPNPVQPTETEGQTALEVYHRFRDDPESLILAALEAASADEVAGEAEEEVTDDGVAA